MRREGRVGLTKDVPTKRQATAEVSIIRAKSSGNPQGEPRGEEGTWCSGKNREGRRIVGRELIDARKKKGEETSLRL